MEVTHTLMFLMLGLVMGAVGQGARTVVGLRKATGIRLPVVSTPGG